jgi:hypothetical protein
VIRFVTLDESKSQPFATLDDVVSFKVYAFDVLGLDIPCVRFLNEIGFASDEVFGVYNNKITNDPHDFEKGILNAADLIRGLSRLPAEIPDVMREMVDGLVKYAMEVINTEQAVYIA